MRRGQQHERARSAAAGTQRRSGRLASVLGQSSTRSLGNEVLALAALQVVWVAHRGLLVLRDSGRGAEAAQGLRREAARRQHRRLLVLVCTLFDGWYQWVVTALMNESVGSVGPERPQTRGGAHQDVNPPPSRPDDQHDGHVEGHDVLYLRGAREGRKASSGSERLRCGALGESGCLYVQQEGCIFECRMSQKRCRRGRGGPPM